MIKCGMAMAMAPYMAIVRLPILSIYSRMGIAPTSWQMFTIPERMRDML